METNNTTGKNHRCPSDDGGAGAAAAAAAAGSSISRLSTATSTNDDPMAVVQKQKMATMNNTTALTSTIVSDRSDMVIMAAEFGTLAEQLDETAVDCRFNAYDDVNKGRIQFPSHKLYGRSMELQSLTDIYQKIFTIPCGGDEDDNDEDDKKKARRKHKKGIVFLSGYSGTGKSALVEEFVSQQQQQQQQQPPIATNASKKSKIPRGDDDEEEEEEEEDGQDSLSTLCPPPLYIMGKFDALHSSGSGGGGGDPLYTISQALNSFVIRLCQGPDCLTLDELYHLKRRLRKFDIDQDTENAAVLKDTLIPDLDFILQLPPPPSTAPSPYQNNRGEATTTRAEGQGTETTIPSPSSNVAHGNNNTTTARTTTTTTTTTTSHRRQRVRHDFNAIQFAVQNFFKAMAGFFINHKHLLLCVFLDDLQWANAASFQLIKALLKDRSLTRILFFCSYRTNEVDKTHFLSLLMNDFVVQPKQQQRQRQRQTEPPQTEIKRDKETDKATDAKDYVDDQGEEKNAARENGKADMDPPEAANVYDDEDADDKQDENDNINDEDADEDVNLVHFMQIYNLSPDAITEFIADCLDLTTREVAPIADAVYGKTLGNIFFVRQALEELVRLNAIYFDVIAFQWQFADNLNSGVPLEQCLTDDVVQMIQGKLATLPSPLPLALCLAAFVNFTIYLPLLTVLLQTEGVDIDLMGVEQLLEMAFEEGLVLRVHHHQDHPQQQQQMGRGRGRGGRSRSVAGSQQWTRTSSNTSGIRQFRFAHDRIREAAREMVPAGHERDQLLVRISHVLLDRHVSNYDKGYINNNNTDNAEDCTARNKGMDRSLSDWRLFSAAQHLNSVNTSLTSAMEMVALNLEVAKIALDKGAFEEAAVFLRAGNQRLDPATCWSEEHYALTLDLKNHLIEAENFVGNHDAVLAVAQEIFDHANVLADKGRAHVYYLDSSNSKHNNNHKESCETALGILKLYGIHLPLRPTAAHVVSEKLLLSAALRGRSLLCMADFPQATDPVFKAATKLLSNTILFSTMAKLKHLSNLLMRRSLRLIVQRRLITIDTASILGHVGVMYRTQGQYGRAINYGNLALMLMRRFPEERGMEYIRTKAFAAVLNSMFSPYRDTTEAMLDVSKAFFIKGDVLWSLGCGLSGMIGYLLSSLPLDAMYESKLIIFEESAAALGRKSFAVIFTLLRQALYNLQGGLKSGSDPVQAKGAVFDEDQAQASLEGDARQMNLREISSVRLFLGIIFDNEMVMDEMLHRLDGYLVFDNLVHRQDLRLVFSGFAALTLLSRARAKKKKLDNAKKQLYRKWANIASEYFGKLSKHGSANAIPVVACYKAITKKKPTVAAYDAAISICGDQALFHLAALMNERCGLMLLEKGNQDDAASEYLKSALWLYSDWGAAGKVKHMQAKHDFLRGAVLQEKAPSTVSDLRSKRAATLATIGTHEPSSDLCS